MAVVTKIDANTTPADRQALVRRMQEIDAKAGVVDDPTMTIEKLHEIMHTLGIRPEDNGASRELMQMRYGDDWDKD